MKCGSRALVWVLALSLWAIARAHASPADDLRNARTEFRAGNYGGAKDLLAPLLYPSAQLSTTDDLAQAHLLLGICYFELGQRDNAGREIKEALALDPTLNISAAPDLYSAPAIAFFTSMRQALEQELAEQAAERERARLRQRLRNTPAVDKSQYWLNFVPLGMGQLQNGQKGKAAFFFASEATMVGLSFGIYLYQRLKYSDGRVPAEDVDTVRNLQIAQIGAGLAGWALYGYGVIDAIKNYEGAVRRTLTDEEIEDLLKEEPSASSFHLVPIVTPHGAGAAASYSWEF